MVWDSLRLAERLRRVKIGSGFPTIFKDEKGTLGYDTANYTERFCGLKGLKSARARHSQLSNS